MLESILITGTIDAKQNRDIITADIPNAVVQTEIDKRKGRENYENARTAREDAH
jgi:hypothetical protein